MEALASRTQAASRARSGRSPELVQEQARWLKHSPAFASDAQRGVVLGPRKACRASVAIPLLVAVSTGPWGCPPRTSGCWQPPSRTALSAQRVGAPSGRPAVLRRIGLSVGRDSGRHPVHSGEWPRMVVPEARALSGLLASSGPADRATGLTVTPSDLCINGQPTPFSPAVLEAILADPVVIADYDPGWPATSSAQLSNRVPPSTAGHRCQPIRPDTEEFEASNPLSRHSPATSPWPGASGGRRERGRAASRPHPAPRPPWARTGSP
jgi:hypothetical protein